MSSHVTTHTCILEFYFIHLSSLQTATGQDPLRPSYIIHHTTTHTNDYTNSLRLNLFLCFSSPWHAGRHAWQNHYLFLLSFHPSLSQREFSGLSRSTPECKTIFVLIRHTHKPGVKSLILRQYSWSVWGHVYRISSADVYRSNVNVHVMQVPFSAGDTVWILYDRLVWKCEVIRV